MPKSDVFETEQIKQPFRDVCRDALTDQMAAINSGDLNLRIPCVRHQFDSTRGNHFHLHPELFIQVSGMAVMRFPHESIRSRAGTVLVVPRGVPHTEKAHTHYGAFRNLVFAHGDNAVSAHIALQGQRNSPSMSDFQELAVNNPPDMSQYLNRIVELRFLNGRFETAIRGLMLTYMGFLMESLSQRPAPLVQQSFKVLQCRRLVRQHLSDPRLNVQLLAKWIACSPDYLSHCFHTETGITLTRFINSQRIQQAQTLLDSSSMNISEIAHACGYTDAGYFTRLFRRIATTTPVGYRKRRRVEKIITN